MHSCVDDTNTIRRAEGANCLQATGVGRSVALLQMSAQLRCLRCASAPWSQAPCWLGIHC